MPSALSVIYTLPENKSNRLPGDYLVPGLAEPSISGITWAFIPHKSPRGIHVIEEKVIGIKG
jgi:hypothetical protein